MLLLAIDTSTTAITVALHDGSAVLAEATTLDARAHAERLAPGMAHVLRAAGARPRDVTHVAVGLGPGPFTGLRVGIVTARAFALATGASVHGACSLDALAHQAWADGRATAGEDLVVATDARRREVYWARYAVSADGASRLAGPAVARPADVATDLAAELGRAGLGGAVVAGRGPVLYPDVFGTASGPLDVSAAYLADLVVGRLGRGEPTAGQEPCYLRRPDATPAAARKAATG